MIGDFNEILAQHERGSQNISANGTRDFNLFLQDTQVLEIPASNDHFTWFRGKQRSKLDRLFVSPEWIEFYPSLKMTLLKRNLSDHCPLLVESHSKNWGPRPFRFLNCWLTNPGCLKLFKEAWSLSDEQMIPHKLQQVKKALKQWNQEEFGSIDKKIESYENRLHEFDQIAQVRELNEEEIHERKSTQAALWEWMKKKESYWAQLSRSKWLKEGDRNTNFFHTVASIRRRRNCIEAICKGGGIEDPSEIKAEAVEFFRNIFKEHHSERPVFSNLDFKTLSHEQCEFLTAECSCDEIDAAVASCDPSKSPGPDGFNFKFVKEAWSVIKDDVYKMIHDFWISSKLPKGCNTAFVTLIPKVENPSGFHQFRPISMVGCLYKIISKLLVRRLQCDMGSLIGKHQSSFIKGRQILDGPLIVGEIIDSCKRNKTEATILKFDFHKAFDSVSWKFLEWILEQMNFPSKWREWFRACVTTASASILINGSPTIPFKLQRGLQQGDPLYPFLFDFVVEALSLLIQKAVSLEIIAGLEVCRNGFKITHLQYANDTILFPPSPTLSISETLKKFWCFLSLLRGYR